MVRGEAMATNLQSPTRRRWNPRLMAWGAIAGLILLPLVAMQVTDEMAWDAADFALFGGLLVGAGALYELAAWRIKGAGLRTVIAMGIAAVVLLVWADGAVGVF